MTHDVPPRVRVTGPRHPRAAYRPVDLESDSRLDGVYLDSLLAAQLRLACRILLMLGLVVGSLPLVFFAAPGLTEVELLGIPFPWLLLGVGVYPMLITLGWRFVVRAERNEDDLIDLTRRGDR